MERAHCWATDHRPAGSVVGQRGRVSSSLRHAAFRIAKMMIRRERCVGHPTAGSKSVAPEGNTVDPTRHSARREAFRLAQLRPWPRELLGRCRPPRASHDSQACAAPGWLAVLGWALVGSDHSHCAKPVDCRELASKCARLGRSVSTVIERSPPRAPGWALRLRRGAIFVFGMGQPKSGTSGAHGSA
jgi:hypothetical protein